MKLIPLQELAIVLIVVVLAKSVPTDTTEKTEKTEKPSEHPLDHSYAEDILRSFEKQLNEWKTKEKNVDWNYETNLTDANLEVKLKVLAEGSDFRKQVFNQISKLKWQDLADEKLRRQFCKLSFIGVQILPKDSFIETEQILSRAEKLLNTLTICDYKDEKKCNLTLRPELTGIMASSRDPDQLEYVWTKWHDVSGKAILQNFPKYVQLLTEAAKLHNYTDMTVGWLRDYEDDNFTRKIDALWQEVKPFYIQLHTYVRYALRKQYGDIVSKDGPIPGHLVGDMWSEKWSNIANLTAPFPDKKPTDVTDEMIKQGITPKKMYRLAEASFISMGLPSLPESFWKKSIFSKPTDRNIVCESMPWDMNDGENYRVSKCAKVSMEDFRLAHNQIGVIQYFMHYKNQRFVFKNPANPGFREAIGDLVALSAMTPSHLKKLDLLKADVNDPQLNINNLYFKALDRVVNLPFAYVMEKWRWDVYQNKINSNQYNCHWWKLSEDIQGIKSPKERSNSDFDAGTEYHIAVDCTYLRYFVSTILEFQLHRELCIEAGEFNPNDENSKPLHLCDITESTKAGNKLKSGMKLGSSKPWPDVLETIIGQREMNSSGLLEYFKPLHEWLKAENAKNQEHIGWTQTQRDCPK